MDEGDLAFADTLTSGVTTPSGVSAPRYGAPAIAAATSSSFSVGQNIFGLITGNPLIRAVSGAPSDLPGTGPCPGLALSPNIRGAGWMDTDTGYVRACARSEASTVTLFPGAAAEIKISATNVTAGCEVLGPTEPPDPTALGSVIVRWTSWNAANPLIGVPQVRTIHLGPVGVTGDQLPVLADKGPDTQLTKDSYLVDYISSWAAFGGLMKADTTSTFDATTGQRTSSAKVTALTLTTVGVRTADPDSSSVRVTIGQASCNAKDRR